MILQTGLIPPDLVISKLEDTANKFWPSGLPVSAADFNRFREEFYIIDIEARATGWTGVDKLITTTLLTAACAAAGVRTPASGLLILGCGHGRLVEEILTTAKQCGIKLVAFNDLLIAHVQATREKVERLPRRMTDDLEIQYHAGDFGGHKAGVTFDVILALFFVTPEILDIRSEETLREFRHRFFVNVRGHLKPQGVFIEDVPDCDAPGYYSHSRDVSASILARRRILLGELGNVALLHVDKASAQPHFVRYIADHWSHLREMAQAGLFLNYKKHFEADESADVGPFVRCKTLYFWSRQPAFVLDAPATVLNDR